MPTIQSADFWRESGRYDAYGKEMLRIKDRGDREMLLWSDQRGNDHRDFPSLGASPTRICRSISIISSGSSATRRRPRFGVMRSREFLMKDAYSFDMDFEGGQAAYNVCS